MFVQEIHLVLCDTLYEPTVNRFSLYIVNNLIACDLITNGGTPVASWRSMCSIDRKCWPVLPAPMLCCKLYGEWPSRARCRAGTGGTFVTDARK